LSPENFLEEEIIEGPEEGYPLGVLR